MGKMLRLMVLGGFLAAAVVLRFYRLDLISFRYDAAEALFRSRDIARGHVPLLGIVNSLGFHNAPGLPWALLPVSWFSPSPLLITGWFALLCVGGIVPMYMVCRGTGKRWAFLLPCSAYLFMPNQLFSARTVWAQWLMVPLYAWALWLLFRVLRGVEVEGQAAAAGATDASSRPRTAMAALALCWAGVCVHLSGLIYLPLAAGAIIVTAVKEKWSAALATRVFAIGCIPCLLLLPSALDWISVRKNPPKEKPAHIEKFESLMPPPLPVGRRVVDSVVDQFRWFANAGQSDDLPLVPAIAETRRAVQVVDAVFLLLAMAGVAALALQVISRRPGVAGLRASDRVASSLFPRSFGGLLLLWIFLPPIVGSILVSRVNSSYFAPGIPALLMLTALLPAGAWNWRPVRVAIGGICALSVVTYVLFYLAILHVIDRQGFVNGQYYIPLRDQLEFARKLNARGVSPQRFVHLSGDWFQRPYDYLLGEVCHAQELSPNPHWAVVEDEHLRSNQPQRVHFMESHASWRRGSVSAVVFDNPETAQQFVDQYYEIPISADGAGLNNSGT